jgi:hypothetical protein
MVTLRFFNLTALAWRITKLSPLLSHSGGAHMPRYHFDRIVLAFSRRATNC